MKLQLTINAGTHEIDCAPGETLFSALRRLAFYGVKFGDEQGLSGADTVLLDGKPYAHGRLSERALRRTLSGTPTTSEKRT